MRGLLQRIFQPRKYLQEYEERIARAGLNEKKSEQQKAFEFIERLSRIPVNKFTDFKSYIDAGCGKVWAAFRAAHLVAGVLVKTQFTVRDTSGKPITRVDPNLQRLLTSPNPYESWEDLMYMWTHHMKFTGNAYWLKDEMNGKGQPLHIYPLMPQYMEIVPDAHTKVKEYRYRVNGRVIVFQPDEIIHFKRSSPKDSLLGVGDIAVAEPLFNSVINADTYQEKFTENGASPSGVLIKKEEVQDQTEWSKFKAWWDNTYGGVKNAGRTAFLNGEWTYQQLGLTAQQMQSLERETLSIKNIFVAMGVPLSVAGLEKAANYSEAKQNDINFRKYECVPLIDIFVGKVNSPDGFIRAFGDNLRLDYLLTGLIDVEQVVKDYRPFVELGAMTLNELREMAGLPRTDNPLHDQYYVTGNMVPLEMAGLVDPPAEELEKVALRLTGKKG